MTPINAATDPLGYSGLIWNMKTEARRHAPTEGSAKHPVNLADHQNTIVEQHGFDSADVRINDESPRTFSVAGRQLSEGGHFEPHTGRIEINTYHTSGEPQNEMAQAMRRVTTHEVMHAMQDVVEHVSGQESIEIEHLSKDDHKRYFGVSGYPKPGRMAELEARFPAAAALAKASPTGDTNLGFWKRDPKSSKWVLDKQSRAKRLGQMQDEAPLTAYAKLHWDVVKELLSQPRTAGVVGSPGAWQRAVQATLAETASYQYAAAHGLPWEGTVPSQAWQHYADEIRRVYLQVRERDDRRNGRPITPIKGEPLQPEPVTLDGNHGMIVFMNRDGDPVSPSARDAAMARVLFDDGSIGFYYVNAAEEKSLSYREQLALVFDEEGSGAPSSSGGPPE